MKAPADVVETVSQGSLVLEIRLYAGPRFGFDYTPPGGKRIRVRAASQEAARLKAEELLGKAIGGKIIPPDVRSNRYRLFLQWLADKERDAKIPDMVRLFLDAKQRKGVEPPTYRSLSGVLTKFAKRFPGLIGDVRDDEVLGWMDEKHVSPRTWNNTRAAIISLFRFARKKGKLTAELTPVECIERRHVSVRVLTYSPHELETILRATPKEWIPWVALGAFCGLRPEEIHPDPRNGGWKPGIQWENILWEKDKVDVPAEVAKDRRRRFAPLTDAAKSFLADWRNSTGRVTPEMQLYRLAWYQRLTWKKDGLRHSFASYRLAITKDMGALSLEMGNSPTMIHRHYLDLKHENIAMNWFAIRPL